MSTRPNKESWVSGLTVPNRIIAFTAHRKNYRFRHMSHPQKARSRQRHTNERLRDTAISPLIGYMRVSKPDSSQVMDLQRDALLAAGVSERHLYSDTASGKKVCRPGLSACLQALREGDTLVVWKLDRLGRSLRHLVNTVHDLTSWRHRSEGPHRPRSCSRYDHACGQAGLRHFPSFGGVRARAHSRTYPRWACLSTRSPGAREDADLR